MSRVGSSYALTTTTSLGFDETVARVRDELAALEAEPELGALLPCNVVLYQHDGRTHNAAVDPERLLSLVDNEELAPTAAEVRQRLAAVVERAAEN